MALPRTGTGVDDMESRRKIPAILHQIWHAVHYPNPPQRYREGTRSFLAHHPGWTYKFWDSRSSRKFLSTYYRWFLPTYIGYDQWIKRVDALRYFLLHFYGGVYLDMDAECWKNIEPLLGDYGFVGCSNYRFPGEVGNGFLAASPGHPLLDQILTALSPSARKNAEDSTGTAFLGKQVRKFANASGDVKIHPAHCAYPQDATGTWRVNRDHPEIYLWNYMDGMWHKPVPKPRILRLMGRGRNMLISLFYRMSAKIK
jgi:mannosyltransferase OCH1-like enzyme